MGDDSMFGAIIGDIIGSPYEFDRSGKSKDFPLISNDCTFTDDTVMTLAIAEALLTCETVDERSIKETVIDKMKKYGNRYPDAGYGARFIWWLGSKNPQPYNSWGNGSAMRVSPAGWLYDDLDTTRQVARWTAEVSHNHAEGIKGADATACAIWLARNRKSKDEIYAFLTKEFDYDLSRTCDQIRPGCHNVESCQQTVPEAIIAFMEGRDFEDVIRNAVSLGGDCDTLTCIAGSMAEAYYGIPHILYDAVMSHLPEDLRGIVARYIDYMVAHNREIAIENLITTK